MRIMECLCFCRHPFCAELSPEVNQTFLLAHISSVLNKLWKKYFYSAGTSIDKLVAMFRERLSRPRYFKTAVFG